MSPTKIWINSYPWSFPRNVRMQKTSNPNLFEDSTINRVGYVHDMEYDTTITDDLYRSIIVWGSIDVGILVLGECAYPPERMVVL